MSDREQILNRVRAALVDVSDSDPQTDTPITWQYGKPLAMDDVVDVLRDRVEDYRAGFVVTSPAEVGSAIVDALHQTGAGNVVLPPGLDADWCKAITDAGFTVLSDEPPLDRLTLNTVDAVVTASAVAIADTGTVVLDHGPDQGRRALSLLPDRHVCVVRSDQVVSDVPEGVARLDEAIRAGRPLTWISGGSATSDIELTRVEGVHGPRHLTVIVVQS